MKPSFNIGPLIAIQTPSVSDDDTQRFTGLFGRASIQMLVGDQTNARLLQ